jgi:uncharacterized protein (DUF433 family)
MSTIPNYPLIVVDATGVARVGASRYNVLHLAGEHYHYGWSAEELLRQHPDLRPEEVYAALTYFYDHYAELLLELNASAARTATQRMPASLSREELLRRKNFAAPDVIV